MKAISFRNILFKDTRQYFKIAEPHNDGEVSMLTHRFYYISLLNILIMSHHLKINDLIVKSNFIAIT
jgi:hypothetical protein